MSQKQLYILQREAKLKGQTNMNSFVNQKKKVVLGQQRKAFGERPKNQNVDQVNLVVNIYNFLVY